MPPWVRQQRMNNSPEDAAMADRHVPTWLLDRHCCARSADL